MMINGHEYTKQQRREFHDKRERGLRDEDRNPNDCRCGRTWYPRYKDPLSRRFDKICPGCGTRVEDCACGI